MAEIQRIVRRPVFIILAAVFATGCAHLFLTPPFEGFDETAHYASVQLIADQGRIPIYGKDRMARDVADYLDVAPQAYASIAPFDSNNGLTYAEAFASPAQAAATRMMLAEAPEKARRFAPAKGVNWQAQHPPLAYIALVPVYQLTKALDWKTHVFFLRFACWLVAFAGLWIGVRATRTFLEDAAVCSKLFAEPSGALGESAASSFVVPALMAAWPFYSPMFFPEMARLGNDSFCLLFAGFAWAALLNCLRTSIEGAKGIRAAVILAVALAAGALTKAFFLPVAIGLGAFLFWRAAYYFWTGGDRSWRRAIDLGTPLVAFAAVFLLVAGWWYVGKFFSTGTVTGSNDMALLKADGGLAARGAVGFSVAHFIKRLASIYLSFSWSGTWSFVKMPLLWAVPLALFQAILFVAYAWRVVVDHLQEARLSPTVRDAPIFIVGPVFAGLAYHAGVQVMLGPDGIGTPGYYLHIFAGPLAFAFALGVLFLCRKKAGRWFCISGGVFALIFAGLAQFYQLTLFAGCSIKHGERRTYQPLECFGDVGVMMERLTVLTSPILGLICYAAGLVLLALAVRASMSMGALRR